MIEVDARDAAGTGLSGNGVIVCAGTYSNGQCSLANSSPSTTITIYPIHASPDVDFYNHKPDALTWAASQYQGLRYNDRTPACAKPGTFCEHIGTLKVTVAGGTPQTFYCPDAECRVEIGQ
jgi:hypothetical protein